MCNIFLFLSFQVRVWGSNDCVGHEIFCVQSKFPFSLLYLILATNFNHVGCLYIFVDISWQFSVWVHGDFKLCMWISIIIYWQSLIPDETLKFSKMTGKILGFITWENSQRRMFSSKVSFDNAQAEAVLLLLCALLPHIMRGWKLLCFYLAPSCKHASVVWCSKIEGPPNIGELMCGSVARKAFHKAE